MKSKKINGYIAWLDILGFKKMVGDGIQFEGNLEFLISMLENDAILYGQKISKPNFSKKEIKVHVMSDTFVLYTEKDSSKDFVNLVSAVWRLIPHGYALMDADFALRGAIAKGEIEILCGTSSLIDSAILFQGAAVNRALELEGRLWGGICAIDNSLEHECIGMNEYARKRNISDESGTLMLPVSYAEIPIQTDGSKNSATLSRHWTISWPTSPVDISRIDTKFERLASQAENSRAKAFAENTKNYYFNIRDGSELPYILCCQLKDYHSDVHMGKTVHMFGAEFSIKAGVPAQSKLVGKILKTPKSNLNDCFKKSNKI